MIWNNDQSETLLKKRSVKLTSNQKFRVLDPLFHKQLLGIMGQLWETLDSLFRKRLLGIMGQLWGTLDPYSASDYFLSWVSCEAL